MKNGHNITSYIMHDELSYIYSITKPHHHTITKLYFITVD